MSVSFTLCVLVFLPQKYAESSSGQEGSLRNRGHAQKHGKEM